MKKYNPKDIEAKWQKFWQENQTFVSKDDSAKDKKYILVEFPYPSGAGLHMGHMRGYTAGDVTSRYWRLRGKEVMFPIGWDAFGLPAENYAIKTGVHPKDSTAQNIRNFVRQINALGYSFDWSRAVDTTDPEYYKWTQWIFLQLFKAGLAYEAVGPINWCPKDKTGLANEEVIDGKCERCGTDVEKKEMRQWFLRITAYAEKLLEGLKHLPEWPDRVKVQQENWIGKSTGALIKFPISNSQFLIEVFTTRPDTIFGATYLVVAPEHSLLADLKSQITNWSEVENYIEVSKREDEVKRTDATKEKTGVELQGIKAVNPATQEEIPVWVADYVLGHYGTGAIMAVPAHDERDFAFAEKFKLPIKSVVLGGDGNSLYIGPGVLINSGEFTGLASDEAVAKMGDKYGVLTTQYKLRDWLFSRQRYWGEPIPIIHCEKCGLVPVPEDQLPVTLPAVEKFEPTGTGESPLAAISEWVNTTCPTCSGPAKRETNTMPQWAGSSWYWLRYADPKNKDEFAAKEKLQRWTPVDVYFGGMEHTTLHLLYSRFWNLFLYDQGLVTSAEPYTKRVPHGIILAADGDKMSKSKGNVVNPDDIVHEHGADTARMYELFLGPHEDAVAWSDTGVIGVRRYLDRVWYWASERISNSQFLISNDSELVSKALHRLVKKVGEGIESFKFNTSISALMSFHNDVKDESISKDSLIKFLTVLYSFAPHIAEELYEMAGGVGSLQQQPWPEYDKTKIVDATVQVVVQVNGKVREKLSVAAGMPEAEVTQLALVSEKIKSALGGSEIKRAIFVQDKLLNLVV